MTRPSLPGRRTGRSAAPRYLDAPVPPVPLPPGRTVVVPERGEFFLRDSGGDGPALLLVHGWMFPSDLNWARTYAPLQRAGYRVLAMDLRGHGRGLRSSAPFRLVDCADDAAGVLGALGLPHALVVGYSLGGPVTQLLAHRHRELVAGMVLCATALDWSDPHHKVVWRTMAGLRLALGAFPQGAWRVGLRLFGTPRQRTAWIAGELSRGSARDLAEAGRELGRFDSRPWAGEPHPPAAVVVMARDRLVAPEKQRALAEALGVRPHVLEGDHDACAAMPEEFVRTLLAALGDLPREIRLPA